jgi:hypothetical protein
MRRFQHAGPRTWHRDRQYRVIQRGACRWAMVPCGSGQTTRVNLNDRGLRASPWCLAAASGHTHLSDRALRIDPISSPPRHDGGLWSFLRDPGLAQTGEKCGFCQGIVLRNPKRHDSFKPSYARITAVPTQPAGFREFSDRASSFAC